MAESQLTRELTKEELAEFRSAFDMFDIDGGGMYLDETYNWSLLFVCKPDATFALVVIGIM
jgi:hypothetical protein